jgi:hypothetical protein
MFCAAPITRSMPKSKYRSASGLQNVLGFSPTEAGAAFVPMALVMADPVEPAERGDR